MFSNILPLVLFCISMTATPGPNNMILTATGAGYGYRASLPFIVGLTLGIQSMIFLGALGLGALFTAVPVLQPALRFVGVGYLFYLAWKIAFHSTENAASGQRPLTALQGALFQYANPKAWIMSMTAISVYTIPGEGYAWSSVRVALVFLIIAPLSTSVWAGFGTMIGTLVRSRRGVWFHRTLGALTAASAVFVIT